MPNWLEIPNIHFYTSNFESFGDLPKFLDALRLNWSFWHVKINFGMPKSILVCQTSHRLQNFYFLGIKFWLFLNVFEDFFSAWLLFLRVFSFEFLWSKKALHILCLSGRISGKDKVWHATINFTSRSRVLFYIDSIHTWTGQLNRLAFVSGKSVEIAFMYEI